LPGLKCPAGIVTVLAVLKWSYREKCHIRPGLIVGEMTTALPWPEKQCDKNVVCLVKIRRQGKNPLRKYVKYFCGEKFPGGWRAYCAGRCFLKFSACSKISL